MAGCLLKGELKSIDEVMEVVQDNLAFFWGKLGMQLTYLKVEYGVDEKLYIVECYFGS